MALEGALVDGARVVVEAAGDLQIGDERVVGQVGRRLEHGVELGRAVADASGRHGYTTAGQRSSRKPGDHGSRFPAERTEAMTAVGLFARFFLGQDPDKTPVMQKAADLLLQRPPVWDEQGGTVDHYAGYYASYALFQMGGKRWTAWQKQLEPTLLKRQCRDPKDGNRFGSWEPACAWGEDGGRVYSTAILALCLQANYRYSRLLH